MTEHDLDLVTDRYLRRFDPFLPPFDTAWPHDSFHWSTTRADIALQETKHAFRNAGLSMYRLARVTDRARAVVEAFGARFDGR